MPLPSLLRTLLGLLLSGAVAVPLSGAARHDPSPPPVVVAARAVPVLPVSSPAGTGWPALDAAVQRIPGYRDAAPTSWVVSDRYGHLGSTLLPAEQVHISPSVPLDRLDSVVRHEWSHVLQSRAYGGDPVAMTAALDAAFGGTGPRGVDGVEDAADCMARQLGATWTHYTACTDPAWRAAAAVLLTGRRL